MINNLEAEKAVLDAIIQDNNAIERIDFLKPECFSDENYRKIYNTAIQLHLKSTPIDQISLYEATKMDLVTELGLGFGSSKIEYHAKLVFDKFQLRQISFLASKLKEQSKDGDPDELINETIYELEKISVVGVTEDVNLSDMTDEICQDIKDRRDTDEESVLKSLTFPSFNKMTAGLMYGNLIGVEGRNKGGKTTFALTLGIDFAIQDHPIAIFSLEMGIKELIWKVIANNSGIEYMKVRNPKGYDEDSRITDKEITLLAKESARKFFNKKMFLYDSVFNEIQIYNTVKRLKKQHDLRFFIVDYLGLIDPSIKQEKREQVIGYLTRFFKKMARELKVVPCILSQQNRSGDIAEGLGLRRDADYSFSIEKPYDIQRETMGFRELKKIKVNGDLIMPTENHFLVNLKRSRHGQQGSNFLAGYAGHSFKELDPASESFGG